MTKQEILTAICLYGDLQADGGVLLSSKGVNGVVTEIHAGMQKALGKESKKKSVQYADTNLSYHSHERMDCMIKAFIFSRKEIGHPMTKLAVTLMLKQFKSGGFTIKECIEALNAAIVGGHQGVYPKKGYGKKDRAVDFEGDENTDYTEGLPVNTSTRR